MKQLGKDHNSVYIRVKILGIFLFLQALLLAPDTIGADVVERIVAIVNNDVISLHELDKHSLPYANKIKASKYEPTEERRLLKKLKIKMLNELIDLKLAEQELKKLKIKVSDKEVERTIKRLTDARDYSKEELIQGLEAEGMTLDDYNKRIKVQLQRRKLVNREVKSKIVITSEDVKKYYEENRSKYAGEKKYHLRNIVIKKSSDEQENEEAIKQIKEILSELKKGSSFQTMATLYSDSTFAAEGGDLGLFKFEDLSPELQDELRGKTAGDFTNIMNTDFGYQIFYVDEIVDTKGKSIEEVTVEIEDVLYNKIIDKEYQTWLKNLRSSSHIKIIEG